MMRPAVKLVVSLTAFAVGLLLAAAGLRQTGPAREQVGELERKLRALAMSPSGYNALFVGTSRVYRQISPAIFDALAAEQGRKVRSFNLGLDGAFAPEDWYNFEQALKLQPHFDWVFLEVSPFFKVDFALPGYSRRLVKWHDLPRTLAALRRWWPERKLRKKREKWDSALRRWMADFEEAWPQLSGHFECFADRLFSSGEGAFALRQSLLTGRLSSDAADSGMAACQGYQPLLLPPKAEDIAVYESDLAKCVAGGMDPLPLEEGAQRNLDRMITAAQTAGAHVITFAAPVAAPILFRPAVNPQAPFLNFCSLEKYPELFLVENRQDRGHLTKNGAEIFTRLLVEEWLRLGTPERKGR